MRFAPALKLVRSKRLNQYLDGNVVMPINTELSPSGACDANCEWCFYRGEHDGIMIDTRKMKDLIREFKIAKIKAISWTGGGEPTLHPNFNDFVELAWECSLKQGMFTNALKKIKYNPKRFDWIRVSKTNYDWNLKNLKVLRKCKTLGMCINYRGDDEEIRESLKIAKSVGADYLQVRPALKNKGGKVFIDAPKIKDDLLSITNYKFEDAGKNREYDTCEGFHFVPFVWQDGNVDVCAYHRHQKEFHLGNIHEKSFIEIMKNAPESVKVRKNCQICCKNHMINKLIYNLRRLEDVDFT